jgi:DNA polymerase-3 subunit gamma/tau
LVEVFEREGIRAGDGVAQEIARRSRGGLRDALSLSDQLASLVGSEPTLADLEQLSEGTGRDEIEALLDRIEAGDRAGALAALPSAEGGERELLAGLLASLRACLLAGLTEGRAPQLELDADGVRLARERFERLGVERLENWLSELLRARERIELLRSVSARWILEATLLDLCRPESTLPLAEIVERLGALEARLAGIDEAGPVATPPSEPRASRASSVPAPSVASVTRPARADPRPATASTRPAEPTARPAMAGSREEEWPRLLLLLETEARTLGEILRARGKLEAGDRATATIRLSGLRPEERAIVDEPRNARIVSGAFTRIRGEACEAALVHLDTSAPKRPSADLFTRQVADSFGGKIVEGT